MRTLLIALATAAGALSQVPETAASIMAKVAVNQDRAERLRSEFVYRQTVLIRMRRGNHKLAREERSEFTVTPSPQGFDKMLASFAGRYEQKGSLFNYDHPHYEYKGVDIDGDVISDLADDLTNDKSRDGIGKDLFPLTAAEQAKYTFRLMGRETLHGRDVYRVAFRPKPHTEDASCWSGDLLADVREYQPVLVTTRLARGIPFWVKTMLGTDLKYLGFSVAYDRFEEGVWFPVSYGGEFEVRAVFVYKRLISLSLTNTGFRRADVKTNITYETESAGSGSVSQP
jgi:hypothetical protein